MIHHHTANGKEYLPASLCESIGWRMDEVVVLEKV